MDPLLRHGGLPDRLRHREPLAFVRDEQVTPAVAGTIVDEHVHAVALLDLESWREGFEARGGRPVLARDEHAITRFEHRQLAALVVPVG